VKLHEVFKVGFVCIKFSFVDLFVTQFSKQQNFPGQRVLKTKVQDWGKDLFEVVLLIFPHNILPRRN